MMTYHTVCLLTFQREELPKIHLIVVKKDECGGTPLTAYSLHSRLLSRP